MYSVLCTFLVFALTRMLELIVISADGRTGNAPTSQFVVYRAWRELAKVIGTPGCISNALAAASELSRVFPPDPLIIPSAGGDSLGLFVSALDPVWRTRAKGEEVACACLPPS